jgi:Secretion system C-terminal sorting domain
MPITVSQVTTGTIPSGLIATKIMTDVVPASDMIPNPFRPGKNFDTVGFVGVGKIIFASPPSLKLGAPLPAGISRPSTLSFSSKATPMTGDTAFVQAYITHFNGTTTDTIASGKYATGITTATFALNTITMNYKPAFSTVWGDSMIVFASSSIYKHAGAKKGSVFYVDNFVWTGYNSVNDINGIDNKVSVFPNPATNAVNFQSSVKADAVEILDISGRKIGAYMMTGNNVSVPTFTFAPGFYIYNVVNEKKEVVGRGKFEIAK